MLRELERGLSLQSPAPTPASGLLDSLEELEKPGTTLDRYEILEVLGEGGFGVVYRARQREPVVREVALKVIKLGMDTREVIGRFTAERQALALMDHPGIAKVFDGGATARGRPYFAMELVEGEPLTSFCDRFRLSLEERIGLFVQVCDAVQHAHQKGVLHRDLKPSNVLASQRDGRATVKVIDFGIAKALHTPLTEHTLWTEQQRLLGTPAYMSPEQAAFPAVDVDTRSDLYALGVLLYEVLVGVVPLEPGDLLVDGLAGFERRLRETVAPTPSDRARELDPEVAARRGLDGSQLRRRLVGDLDAILGKALARERERRYAAVGDLAADLERYLAHEPVEARPLGMGYRLGKLAVRHRALVLSGLLVFLSLLGGIVGTGLGLLEASRQRDEARQQAERARAVTDFLVETLSLADPEVARAPDLSVATLLDHASSRVSGAFADQPRAEIRLRTTMGRAYTSLGEEEAAETHLRRAVALAEGMEDLDGGEFYDLLWSLTQVLFRLERLDSYAVAQRAREVGLAYLSEGQPALGAELSQFYAATAEASRDVEGGAIDRARQLFWQTTETAEEMLPPGDPLWGLVADTWQAAGLLLWYGPNERVAVDFWQEALEVRRREEGAEDPETGEILTFMVEVLNRAGRHEEAEERIRGAIEVLRGVGREDYFQLAVAESLLGEALVGQGRFAEAEGLLLASHRSISETVGFEHSFFVTMSASRLIRLYGTWGREEEGERWRRELARIQVTYAVPWELIRPAFGARTAALREAVDQLNRQVGGAALSTEEGRAEVPPNLEAQIDEVIRWRQALLPVDDPLALATGRQLLALAETLAPGASDPLRRKLAEEAVSVLRPWTEEVPLELAGALALLCRLPTSSGRDDVEASAHAREVWGLLEDLEGQNRWDMAVAKVRAGRCLWQGGLRQEARILLETAAEALEKQLGAGHGDVLEARRLLAEWAEADSDF